MKHQLKHYLIYIPLALSICFMGINVASAADVPANGGKEFAGTHFGIGLTITQNNQEDIADRVEDAQIINGIVRVTKERNQVLRLMLETHYFFTPNISFFNLTHAGTWGFGPFVGVQTGSDEIIDAIGGGMMIGFKRTGSNESFNIGIGYVIDNNVKVLGNGFSPDQPPPAGETEVRFKEKTQGGVLLLVSFAF